jgi:hypothetical protein
MCVWDSAVQEHLYTSANFDCAKKLFFDSGVPLSYYEMIPFARMINFILIFKLLSVSIFFIASLITARIFAKLRLFNTFEIYFISVTSFFYPCYALWMHFIMFPYYLSLLAFTLAVYCFLRYHETMRTSWSIITAILLLFAFNIQSFLVYHYALLGVYFFFKFDLSSKFYPRLVLFLKLNWVFLLLPFIYFFSNYILFPKAGIYKQDAYNSISTDLWMILQEMSKSLVNVSLTAFAEFVKYFMSDLISASIYSGIAAAIVLIIAWNIKSSTTENFTPKVFLLGIVIACFTLLPYALVGKHVSTHGYETRHSLLSHTALLISIVILFRLLKGYSKYAILAFLFFSFFMFLKQQVHWENRYQKMEAIEQVIQNSDKPLGNIVFITEKDHAWDMNEYLRFYECNMILKDALHNEQQLGINDEREAHNSDLARKYIDRYMPYKNCLFFESFKDETTNITDIEITEKEADDAILFLNSLTEKDKRQYYSRYIHVDFK